MTYPLPSSAFPPLPLKKGTQEPDELTRFRDDWKHEVELHRTEVTHGLSADTAIPPPGGLPDAQRYTAGELPQAQDSFVS